RTTSALPACRRKRSATHSSSPLSVRGRPRPRYATQPPSDKYRRTVMWLHPSSPAIRRTPHPSAFNRSIAATSSGVCITSLRGNSPREVGCTQSSIIEPSSLQRGPVLNVAKGPVSSVARHAHPRRSPMEHRTQLEIDSLQRAEGVLDAAETLVGVHRGGSIGLCGR